jgi:autotransporter-associated beta strand protein
MHANYLLLPVPQCLGAIAISPARQILKAVLPRFAFFAAVAFLLLSGGSALAAQLIWDPLANNSGAGSGNWDTTAGNNFWWNGTSDTIWSQTTSTSPTMGAVFNGPDAAAGTYNITNDAVQVAITNLQVNNNGYTFYGANAIYVGANDTLSVAPNKTVTFNCPMAGSGTSPFWVLGSGATMNVPANITSGQQVRLAGAAGSVFNLSGVDAPAILYVLSQVNLTAGSMTPSSSFFIGYPQLINGTAYSSGTLNVSGSATATINGGIFIIGRATGSGTLILTNNASVTIGNSTANRNLAINYDSSASSSGTVNVYGGTLTVGSGLQPLNVIDFFDTAGSGVGSGATATLNQTGGTINAVNGIVFGPTSGSFVGGTAALTNSGGFLYVGAKGIGLNTVAPPVCNISLSGGTVGATANWSSSMPMTLASNNGNITFQCADAGGFAWNISLSGALSGSGGFYETGGGTLALSGTNAIAGNIVVSNGTLAIVTGSPMTYGPITLDGSTASPTLSARVSNRGQSFTNGSLTFSSGTPTADFQFGSLTPSTTTGAIQVNGNLNFTAPPAVTVEGTALAVGTYPLIQYSNTLSGTMPNSLTLPVYATGYVTNLTAGKTIALVITSSTYNPALIWAIGNGLWNTNAINWKQFGNPTNYTDGNAVLFDDTASGASPITITLNTNVSPSSMTANNSAKQYIITGTGSIGGIAGLTMLGGGTLTLKGTNTYSGGTTVSAGQLNINNGGTATASAIGTGTLTLNNGVVLDNTSGADVTLQTVNAETWGGNFSYAGSTNNFNTGTGQITMNGPVSINVSSNALTVGGNISDNGNSYQLTKTGNGALTLPVGNSFGGGLTLQSGLLNLGDPNATGQGVFAIYGGSIDNVSGQTLQLSGPSSYTWGGSFNFVGTTNLDLNTMQINIPNGIGGMTLNVASNTLYTEGLIVNNNTTVTKTGGGTWDIGGGAGGTESLGLIVSGGKVILEKSGQAISGGNNFGLTVNTNGLVVDGNNFQIHSASAVAVPVNLSGGVWDLNGFNENIDKLNLSSGGTLRNSATSSISAVKITPGDMAQLSGTNCTFDIETPDAVLNINGIIAGSGSLLKIGAGLLNLNSNNVYTGNTIIENGTLALPGASSISDSAVIYLATTNAALDLTQNMDTNGNPTPTLALMSGQTLGGFGVVTGLVQTAAGSTLAPGSSTTVGQLTVLGISGSNILNGVTMMKLNKGGPTNDELSVSGSLVYGGTLALTNMSGNLAAGDSFKLFSVGGGASGAFATITPLRPGFPAFGLAWDTNNLTTNGTLAIISASVPPPPVISAVTQSGNTLTISGTNGLANEPFIVLATTNLTLPLASWMPVATNAFDGSGHFSVALTITITPQLFFTLSVQ